MKKLVLLLLLVPTVLYAPGYDAPCDAYRVKDIFLEAIIQVESEGNQAAINASENAVGILQIRPVMIAEANRLVGYEKFSLKDRESKERSIEIWYTVQAFRNPSYDLESACNLWNSGHVNSKLSAEYIRKVQAIITKALW